MRRLLYIAAALTNIAAASQETVTALVDVTPGEQQQIAFIRQSDGCRFTGQTVVNPKSGWWMMNVTYETCGQIQKPVSAVVRPLSVHSAGPLLRAGEQALLVRDR